jgi:hypothetical protein
VLELRDHREVNPHLPACGNIPPPRATGSGRIGLVRAVLVVVRVVNKSGPPDTDAVRGDGDV